jgi:hypothetical protein
MAAMPLGKVALSATTWLTAANKDAPGQVAIQTSYIMIFACGATPEIVSVKAVVGAKSVEVTTLPATVLAVWLP